MGEIVDFTNHQKVLSQVRDLLGDGSSWTMNAYARDSLGMEVDPRESRAYKWCLVGAISKVTNKPPNVVEETLLADRLRAQLPSRNGLTLTGFNDEDGWEAVAGLLDSVLE